MLSNKVVNSLVHIKWILLPFTVFILLRWFYGFDGLYGQDAYEYLRFTESLQKYILTGEHPGNFFWPIYYPLLGAVLGLVLEPAWALQLISLLSLFTTAFYIIKTLRLLYQHEGYVNEYVVVFYIMAPMVVKSGMIIMSDMMATTLITSSIYFAVKYIKRGMLINVFIAFTLGMLAILTRYAAFVVLFPIGLFCGIIYVKRKVNYRYIPVFIVLIFMIYLPVHLLKNKRGFDFLNHQWLQNWSIFNFFKSNFTTVDGIANYKMPNIIYGFSSLFHPFYFILGLAVIMVSLFRKVKLDPSIKLFMISIALYAVFLAGIPFQNKRFLLLSFPLIVIIFYKPFIELFKCFKFKKLLLVFVVFIQVTIAYKILQPIIDRNKLELQMVEFLNPFQNQVLYSFDIDIALKGRKMVFDYKNLWGKKYDHFENEALVLFHPTKFNEQWKGKNPILNWRLLNTDYHLVTLMELPQGWMLYQVQSAR